MRASAIRVRAGFTLAEMLVSVGCGTLILAAVIAAGVSLQKTLAAMDSYSIIEEDQLRVLDYIAMDCRRAIAANINTVTVNGVTESALVLTLAPFYSSTTSTAAANAPAVTNGAISYGTDIVTITYEQNGTNFTREVKATDSTGSTVRSDYITPIAKNVSSFTANPIDLTTNVSCSIMFFPNFLKNSGRGTWRSGLYTPNDQAPADSLGSNGDWYAINSTATDASTVGDVYCKSNGSYSKIENVKATTVSVNTFLRNAIARH